MHAAPTVRRQVDADMMDELRSIKSSVTPSDTLLVVDAMTGQEAANLVRSFNEQVDITGEKHEACVCVQYVGVY